MWLLQGTRPENSRNKFSLWQGRGEFNPFLARLMDSSLYNSGQDPRNTCATSSSCFPYINYCWPPLVSLSQSCGWNGFYIGTTSRWWLFSGWDGREVVKNKQWTWFSSSSLWCFSCDHEFRLLKNRMLPFHHTLQLAWKSHRSSWQYSKSA